MFGRLWKVWKLVVFSGNCFQVWWVGWPWLSANIASPSLLLSGTRAKNSMENLMVGQDKDSSVRKEKATWGSSAKQEAMGTDWSTRGSAWISENICFFCAIDRALAQAPKEVVEVSLWRDLQEMHGHGHVQLAVVGRADRGIRKNDLQRSFTISTILWFCEAKQKQGIHWLLLNGKQTSHHWKTWIGVGCEGCRHNHKTHPLHPFFLSSFILEHGISLWSV